MVSGHTHGCTTRTTLHLVGTGSWTAVSVSLDYHPAEPFTVRLLFGTDDRAGDGHGGVEWLLGRDLLQAGLTQPAGEGDVRVWPARGGGDSLFLQLRAPSGEAVFEASAAAVTAFLAQTQRIVPVGTETDLIGVDAELLCLLRSDDPGPGAG